MCLELGTGRRTPRAAAAAAAAEEEEEEEEGVVAAVVDRPAFGPDRRRDLPGDVAPPAELAAAEPGVDRRLTVVVRPVLLL